jgi:solute carrier family 45 protein 1/2/4
MILLALTKTKSSALILSPAAGIMYSTLFTVPYLLVAKYHQLNEQVNEKVN